jgi:hypothetical protein
MDHPKTRQPHPSIKFTFTMAPVGVFQVGALLLASGPPPMLQTIVNRPLDNMLSIAVTGGLDRITWHPETRQAHPMNFMFTMAPVGVLGELLLASGTPHVSKHDE